MSETSLSATLALPAMSQAVSEMIDQVRPSVVQVQSGGRGGGTGVIWHATGTIITNAHVIGESQQINVALLDGRRFAARVRSSNPALDLAILEIDADGL